MNNTVSLDTMFDGLPALGDDPGGAAFLNYREELRQIARRLHDEGRTFEVPLLRTWAIKALKQAGIGATAGIVDEALSQGPTPGTDSHDSQVGTIGPGIIDVVSDGDDLAWITDGGMIVPEHGGRRPWPRGSLPWKTIPTRVSVEAAIHAGARAPWEALCSLLQERVVLPKPERAWSYLLVAWILGTYLLDRFTYWPLLLLEGPPERGKTRLGKAIIFPCFRGIFTPSPTPAVLFRYREYHRVALLLDVEDLPSTLERSDLGELILNSFERDGVVPRTTRPDAPPQDQVEYFSVYGPTILITNRPIPDHGPLRSRCIRVPMPEAGSVAVPDAVTPDDVVEIRAQILAWASRVADTPLPEVDVPFTGRMRDNARPILRVLALVNPQVVDEVVLLLGDMDKDRRQEASRSWEARVAVALWEARYKVEAGRLYLEDLKTVVNKDLPMEEHLSPQNIGTARRNLGLKSARGGAGGRTFIHWPGEEEARLLHDRYSPKEPGLPSGCSASSETPGNIDDSPLNTLNTRKEVFSPKDPRKTYTSEHPEHPEHPSGKFSRVSGDLFEEVAA